MKAKPPKRTRGVHEGNPKSSTAFVDLCRDAAHMGMEWHESVSPAAANPTSSRGSSPRSIRAATWLMVVA